MKLISKALTSSSNYDPEVAKNIGPKYRYLSKRDEQDFTARLVSMKEHESENPNAVAGQTVFLAVFEFVDGEGIYSADNKTAFLHPGEEVTIRIKLAPLSARAQEYAMGDVFNIVAGVLNTTPAEVQRDPNMEDYFLDEFAAFKGQMVGITAEKEHPDDEYVAGFVVRTIPN